MGKALLYCLSHMYCNYCCFILSLGSCFTEGVGLALPKGPCTSNCSVGSIQLAAPLCQFYIKRAVNQLPKVTSMVAGSPEFRGENPLYLSWPFLQGEDSHTGTAHLGLVL